ncbi:MAG: helix-turn-helix transcriptional regulator [Flavobacterium sp.]|nr:helix-turn-helix transcriptional regulator [Flavobacterium sp.]
MVNSENFIQRLEYLLDYYSLSASGFADKIGVQRSSLSHLLSGRNKPSLDFVMKINEVFKDVDLYWILNGKGNFLKSENLISNAKNEIESKKQIDSTPNQNIIQENLFSENKTDNNENAVFENKIFQNQNTALSSIEKKSSEIERIVIFYKNGSFTEHQPQ